VIAFEREGRGKVLLLVHGLGGNRDSFAPIAGALAARRELIRIDLPGHGQSPAKAGSDTFAGLADQLERFLDDEGLHGIDMVGSSLGARLVLEMARRGKSGQVVARSRGILGGVGTQILRGHDRRVDPPAAPAWPGTRSACAQSGIAVAATRPAIRAAMGA